MKREDCEHLPMIELAELLCDNSPEHEDDDPSDIFDTLDRWDTINELDDLGLFDE